MPPVRSFFSRLALLFALAALLSGCVTSGRSSHYYRVTATDYEGDLIAEFIARGRVQRVENGYRLRAVERTTGGPYPQHMRYPEGRVLDAVGPNLTVSRCAPPSWLVTTTTTSQVTGYDK